MFLGKWFTAQPGKKFPVRLCAYYIALPFFFAGYHIIFKVSLERNNVNVGIQKLVKKIEKRN